MPVTAPIVTDTDGKTWYIWDFRAKFAYPFDPDAPVFLLAAPPGGAGIANAPFLIKGDNGLPALIDPEIDFVALEYGDSTPDSAELIELTPATETTSQVSQLKLRIHKGAPGSDGTSVLDPDAYGTPIPGRLLQVNATSDGFEYTAQKVGKRYWPASVTEAGAGTTSNANITVISILANTVPFDYQIECAGEAIVTAAGSDCRVDLVARLNSITGPVLARGYGMAGTSARITLTDGPDTGTATNTVTVAANAAATIYLRTEKQSGTDTYSTGASPTRFLVKVVAA